jgi:hypothetical protein
VDNSWRLGARVVQSSNKSRWFGAAIGFISIGVLLNTQYRVPTAQ